MAASENAEFDALIVGGGPAGLSAATLLGRCLRKVLVCDAGRPRNEASRAMHAYLGLDGIHPAKFLQDARDQLSRYDTVELLPVTIEDVQRDDSGFTATCVDARRFRARAVLIATGLVDILPTVPNVLDYYGISLHHCPYCDAWEHRGGRLGVLGADEAAVSMALELMLWTEHVTLFTLGVIVSPNTTADRLRTLPIRVVEGPIEALEGQGGKIETVRMQDGTRHPCDALFFSPTQAQQSPLARKLGCDVEITGGTIATSVHDCSTSIEGLFVAGNASKGIQMVIVAAAEGVKAAAAINDWLLDKDRSRLGGGNR